VLIGLTASRSWATKAPKKSSTTKSSTPTIGELYYFRMQSKLKSRANIRRVKGSPAKPRIVQPPSKAPVRRIRSSRPRTTKVVRKFKPQMKRHSASTFLVLSKALVGHPRRRASSRIHKASGRQDGRTVRVDLDPSLQHRRKPVSRPGSDRQTAGEQGSSASSSTVVAPSTLKRLQLQFELLQMGDSLQ
jgi:hypothetical protein